MNQKPHELFHPASFVLSRDNYDELCTIRDKLLLMAQLAGTATSNGDHDTILFIRRSLIGQLFGDLSFQIDDVLEDVAKARNVRGSRAGALIHEGAREFQIRK